ncbi:MAG TPA: hypothetical protein VMQ58_00410 [Candidatus Saccharimonadales bacterium]|jgi:hypothetical protein|nr:hypothetical protein [Candidatus Saccharimonadales bacterium]
MSNIEHSSSILEVNRSITRSNLFIWVGGFAGATSAIEALKLNSNYSLIFLGAMAVSGLLTALESRDLNRHYLEYGNLLKSIEVKTNFES